MTEKHPDFLEKNDLKKLSINCFKLAFLFDNLSYDGPLLKDYVREKIECALRGDEVILHPNLEKHMIDTLKGKAKE